MHYIVEYEVCALIFLIVVANRFFNLRRFPDIPTKLFGIILWIAIADLSLDILGSYTIEYAAFLPAWVNYVINTVFYSIQVVFPAIMMIYVICTAGKRFSHKPSMFLLLTPAILSLGLIILNPLTKGIFYLENVEGILVYMRGPFFISLYVGSVFYFVITSILVICFRKDLRNNQVQTILSFIAINFIAMGLQYFFPAALLTGVGISLAILMMFFILENPEYMLDLITGIFNYNAMLTYLNNQIADKHRIWLIALDVGGIRRINDSFGIQGGNQALSQVGTFLSELEGKHAWAFRMIGTRFLIVADNEKDYREIFVKAKKRFRDPWNISDVPMYLTGTIRHFSRQNFFKSPQDVINLIDLAYDSMDAKDIGTIAYIDGEILMKAKRFVQVEEAIREALQTENGFYINIQPIYNISEKKYKSGEILLRLNSRKLGMVFPDEFIAVAEKTGLIFQIDRMVINRTCNFLKENSQLKALGLEYLNVNLSATEFFTDIQDMIHSLVLDSGGIPEMLCFEVTETAAATHPEVLNRFMNKMIAWGYRFALDDFGMGFANLTQVAGFPFSIVKIDRTLLNADAPSLKYMFEDLIKMFSRMGLKTVTEGVETLEQAERVKNLSGNYIQGFYYSHPLGEKEFAEFIAEKNNPAK